METRNKDDQMLDAQDMAAEITESRNSVVLERRFEDVLNQWTNELLVANRAASDIATITLITRLGSLGQRLIYEANSIGMREACKFSIEALRDA